MRDIIIIQIKSRFRPFSVTAASHQTPASLCGTDSHLEGPVSILFDNCGVCPASACPENAVERTLKTLFAWMDSVPVEDRDLRFDSGELHVEGDIIQMSCHLCHRQQIMEQHVRHLFKSSTCKTHIAYSENVLIYNSFHIKGLGLKYNWSQFHKRWWR